MIKEKLEKLEVILQKKEERFKENLPYLLLFFVIFVLLFFMHHVIAMYFDDFGNASLSYATPSPDVLGTHYTFAQLLDWCKTIYMGWGGRILWASVFLIPLLKFGAGIYFAIQSVVITLILYTIFKIAEQITKTKHIFLPIVLFILYGLINMVYLKHGIYWASASILYIWPLLPMFLFIYLFLKLTEKQENKEKINYYFYLPVLIILNFFATFSQEQIAVAMVVFLILYIIFCHGKKVKQFKLLDITNGIVCILSFAALMLAPGNYARLDTNVEFANLSLTEKIIKNFPTTIASIFRSEMTLFMVILTIVFIACLLKYRKSLKIKEKTIVLSNVLFILFSILCFLLQKYIKITVGIYGIIWIIYIGIWMLIYGYQRKQMSIPVIAITGCSSIFCLLVSPVLGGRTNLPFIFFIFILIAIFTSDFLKDTKKMVSLCFLICMIPFALKGAINYYATYNGYLENKPIEDLNFEILKHHENTDKKIITLYKSKTTWFGSTRSYEEPSMDYWIKEYFNIPQDVEFQWVDIYEDIRE